MCIVRLFHRNNVDSRRQSNFVAILVLDVGTTSLADVATTSTNDVDPTFICTMFSMLFRRQYPTLEQHHYLTSPSFCYNLNIFVKLSSGHATRILALVCHSDSIVRDKSEIVNKFNDFFTNIGSNLASNIKYKGTSEHTYLYLNKIVDRNFTFSYVEEDIIKRTIVNLPNKSSCGYDGQSPLNY